MISAVLTWPVSLGWWPCFGRFPVVPKPVSKWWSVNGSIQCSGLGILALKKSQGDFLQILLFTLSVEPVWFSRFIFMHYAVLGSSQIILLKDIVCNRKFKRFEYFVKALRVPLIHSHPCFCHQAQMSMCSRSGSSNSCSPAVSSLFLSISDCRQRRKT